MPDRPHPFRLSLGLLPLVAAALLCGGCASLDTGKTANTDDLPHLAPGRNQVLAWVPQSHAQTGVVAQAMAHIALAKAKKVAEAELCEGTWMFSGKLQQDGPALLARAPQELGEFSGWYVRISWEPKLAECGVDAQRYSLALSKHLPSWMMTQSGAPLALYHQGIALYHQDDRPRYAFTLHND